MTAVVRDIVFPGTDLAVLVQVIVVIVVTVGLAVVARRERSLVLLVVGGGMVTLGLIGVRGLH